MHLEFFGLNFTLIKQGLSLTGALPVASHSNILKLLPDKIWNRIVILHTVQCSVVPSYLNELFKGSKMSSFSDSHFKGQCSNKMV